MLRCIAFILLFMTLPQLTFAGQESSLKHLIQSYKYFLTVEWDQKDMKTHEAVTKEFQKALTQELENGSEASELQTLLGVHDLDMRDLDAVAHFIQEQKQEVRGASWNGEVLGPVIIIGVVAAGLTAFILYARSRNKAFADCVEANGGNEDLCIDR